MASEVRNYTQLAKDILKAVGGKGNISNAGHCATRLRLVLKATPAGAKEKVSAMPGVITVVEQGGQFQIVIGTHVTDVFAALSPCLDMDALVSSNKSLINIVVGALAACVAPLAYVLAACGLLQGALIIATMLSPEVRQSGTFQILTFMSWTPFVYLPVLIALTGAKYFKVDTLCAVLCTCALVNPSWGELAGKIAAGADIRFLFFPLAETTYTSTVLPPIIILAVLYYVEKFFKNILPEVLKPIFVPLACYLIMVPATLIVLGPVTSGVAHALSYGFQFFYDTVPWLCAFVFGALWQCIVIFGVHWTFMPVFMADFEQYGYSTLQVFCAIAVCAQVGGVFGVWFKSRNKRTRSVAMSAGLTGLFGITEPAIYGITLPLKKPFACVCIAAGFGSMVSALLGTMYFAFAGLPGILTVPNAYNEAYPNSLLGDVVGTAVAMIGAFVLVQIIGFTDKVEDSGTEKIQESSEKTTGSVQAEPFTLASPLAGTAKALSECGDAAFASGAMGKGVVIEPEEGKLYAPCDGQVIMLFETLHAIGLKSREGAEILIHIGMDTVKLAGKGFKSYVKNGDQVKQGDLLLEFDISSIKEQGYRMETPVLITNVGDFTDIVPHIGSMRPGDKVLDVIPG